MGLLFVMVVFALLGIFLFMRPHHGHGMHHLHHRRGHHRGGRHR